MLSVSDMIVRIRASTHDKQETGYTDKELLGYINDGVRLIRRTILQTAPAVLADAPIIGTTVEGETSVTLDKQISKIISVFVNEKQMHRINNEDIRQQTGEPHCYFISNFNTINFYPFPDKPINYFINVVNDMQLLTLEDNSPFPNELDDFLYEYGITRASIGNEFDVSQESTIMSNMISQIESTVRRIDAPDGLDILGYWDRPYHRYKRYGAHYGRRY